MMTHTVSLLCWLSAELEDVLMRINTDSSTMLLSAMLSGWLHCNVQQAAL